MKKANESLLKISERWLLMGWAGGPPWGEGVDEDQTPRGVSSTKSWGTIHQAEGTPPGPLH